MMEQADGGSSQVNRLRIVKLLFHRFLKDHNFVELFDQADLPHTFRNDEQTKSEYRYKTRMSIFKFEVAFDVHPYYVRVDMTVSFCFRILFE